MKKVVAATMLFCCLLHTVSAQNSVQTSVQNVSRDKRMEWWREARFGMFIHWGVYAVPAGYYNGHSIARIGEWIMNRGKIPVADYQAFAASFNPVKYDPD